ncbi:iron chelate uptake ABC transporter family permease subunit [Lipingzhangella sp. LS1_29]|uniref:Iron chelate uptake ABC transporter family permease subunit n=1 Tax=Lipingzhangella rawalii TaxID=2055835 RepID=A0ABU2H6X4_9ACTN|nr:iron chelate uptake ABC transporter family permease subunit [Lipingzhangella rawalii]MDS1271041.1 iron chelate uptake ABC transporter family permease subunit [Lipingzhangella rawalii]
MPVVSGTAHPNTAPDVPSPTPVRPRSRRLPSPWARIAILAVAAALCILAYVTYDITGNVSYVVERRTSVVVTMLVVAFCGAISTVLFHTVTDNRILTPSIMGMEALFVLVQTCLVFVFGIAGLNLLPPVVAFLAQTALMVVFALLLFNRLFTGGVGSLHLMLLVGIVFGVLFTSLSQLMQRLLDPNEFTALQTRLFARLTRADAELLPWVSGLVILIAIYAWRRHRMLDVLALGRDTAVNLGVDHTRTATRLLVVVTLLVAISTALVGPMTFFGFVAATLAYQIAGRHEHRYVLPVAFLVGLCTLVGGQFVLEHLLGHAGTLTVVIEFVGGALFLYFLLRKAAR